MHRALLPSYLCVASGLLIGVLAATYLPHTEPPIIGWAFGVGGGLAFGSWIAAMASGTPLAGSSRPRRYIPLDDCDDIGRGDVLPDKPEHR